jgi:hypothetical protein
MNTRYLAAIVLTLQVFTGNAQVMFPSQPSTGHVNAAIAAEAGVRDKIVTHPEVTMRVSQYTSDAGVPSGQLKAQTKKPNYLIRTYETGDENQEYEISIQISLGMVWPYGHTVEELRQDISSPRFDPRSRIYAFADGEMVAYTFFWISRANRFRPKTARLSYPWHLPGHQGAAEPLILRALEILTGELELDSVQMRAGTVWPGSVEVTQRLGFSETEDRPLGFKKYYTYDLARGELAIPTDLVDDFDLSRDLNEASRLACIWYKQSIPWCRDNLMSEVEYYDGFAHLVVRDGEELVAACMVAPNFFTGKETVAALYYQYALRAEALRPMIAEAVKRARTQGFKTLLVDLIYDHLHFEPTYRALGFELAAEFGLYEWKRKQNN